MDEKPSSQGLHELSTYLEQLHEAERSDIARDIHDNVTSLLTAIKLDMSWLEKRCDQGGDELDGKFRDLSEHLNKAINTTRQLIADLRPSVLDELGLVAAIEWYCSEFTQRQTISCSFDFESDELNLKDKRNEITVFRIYQEALNNIAKHANANGVKTQLRRIDDKMSELIIDDDGAGIDIDKTQGAGFGILGMQQRARNIGGELAVTTNEQGGTRICLLLPVS